MAGKVDGSLVASMVSERSSGPRAPSRAKLDRDRGRLGTVRPPAGRGAPEPAAPAAPAAPAGRAQAGGRVRPTARPASGRLLSVMLPEEQYRWIKRHSVDMLLEGATRAERSMSAIVAGAVGRYVAAGVGVVPARDPASGPRRHVGARVPDDLYRELAIASLDARTSDGRAASVTDIVVAALARCMEEAT